MKKETDDRIMPMLVEAERVKIRQCCEANQLKKKGFNSLRSDHRDCERARADIQIARPPLSARQSFLIELILAINTGSGENTQSVGP